MNDAQIKHMVDRFLSWRLPKPWYPDNGISYKRPNYAHPPADHDWPTGTNLFDATLTCRMLTADIAARLATMSARFSTRWRLSEEFQVAARMTVPGGKRGS